MGRGCKCGSHKHQAQIPSFQILKSQLMRVSVPILLQGAVEPTRVAYQRKAVAPRSEGFCRPYVCTYVRNSVRREHFLLCSTVRQLFSFEKTASSLLLSSWRVRKRLPTIHAHGVDWAKTNRSESESHFHFPRRMVKWIIFGCN